MKYGYKTDKVIKDPVKPNIISKISNKVIFVSVSAKTRSFEKRFIILPDGFVSK